MCVFPFLNTGYRSTLQFIPLVLSVVAITLGTAGVINCRTVEIPASVGSRTIEAGVFAYRTKGLWTTNDAVYVVDVCRPYTDIRDDFGFDYEEDHWIQTLQRIAFTIPILGGMTLIGNCIYLCSGVPHPLIWKLIGLCFVTCSILQGIQLKIMDSYICTDNPIVQYLDEAAPNVGALFQNDCEYGMGMRMGITAIVFWGLAGLSCFVIVSPEKAAAMPADMPKSEGEAVEEST